MTDPERARFVEWIETAMHNAQMLGTSPWAHAAELAAECIERAVRHLNREVDEPYPVRLSGGDIDWESDWPIPWRFAMGSDDA